jgi:hypothetical protein
MGWSVSQQNAGAGMENTAAEERAITELGLKVRLLPVSPFALQ